MLTIDFDSTPMDIRACKNVIDFYLLTLKLKDMVRTGWKHWNVDRENNRFYDVAISIWSAVLLFGNRKYS